MIDVETIASKWANVYELALPADLEGGYDAANNRILISDRLTPIQRRCVLAHEISHARHHDVGCKCDSATERRADMEAARQAQQQAEQQQAQQQTAPPSIGTVRGGSFCSSEGSTGTSSAGNILTCRVASDGRLRWMK